MVRQTVSKWEKGLPVPDADTLIRLAEVLEVSVSELLGAKIKSDPPQVSDEVIEVNNEQ